MANFYRSKRKRMPRKVWQGLIRGFKPTNPIYAFIFGSIVSSTVAWITVSANNSVDPRIKKDLSHKNLDIQNSAVWAVNFVVAFVSAMAIYMLLYLLFGFGEGMTQNDPWSTRQILRILKKLKMPKKLPNRSDLKLYPHMPGH